MSKDSNSLIQHLRKEQLMHKEHRHRHVVQKLLVSGGVLGIGQLIGNQDMAFFVILSLPFICLVHDIYIFSEHYKVRRIGHFLSNKINLESNHPIMKWEDYVKNNRERFAVWGSLLYTILLFGTSAAIVKVLQVQSIIFHEEIYTGWLIGTALSILGVFLVYYWLGRKLEQPAEADHQHSG